MATTTEILQRIRQANVDALAVRVRMRERIMSLIGTGAVSDDDVDNALLVEYEAKVSLAMAELAILKYLVYFQVVDVVQGLLSWMKKDVV